MNGEEAIDAKYEDPTIKKRKETDDCQFEQSKPNKKPVTPVGRFKSFTPLNTPINQVLMQIQDNLALRWPNRIRSDPDR